LSYHIYLTPVRELGLAKKGRVAFDSPLIPRMAGTGRDIGSPDNHKIHGRRRRGGGNSLAIVTLTCGSFAGHHGEMLILARKHHIGAVKMNIVARIFAIGCLVSGALAAFGYISPSMAEDGISGNWKGTYSRAGRGTIGNTILVVSENPTLVGRVSYSQAPTFGTDMKALFDVSRNGATLKFSARGDRNEVAATTLEIVSNGTIMTGTMNFKGNDFDIWIKKAE